MRNPVLDFSGFLLFAGMTESGNLFMGHHIRYTETISQCQ